METSAAIRPDKFDSQNEYGEGFVPGAAAPIEDTPVPGAEGDGATIAVAAGQTPRLAGRALGALRTWRETADGAVEAEFATGCARLQWLEDGVLRVRFYRGDGFAWRTSPGIERYRPAAGSGARLAEGEVILCGPDGRTARLAADGHLTVADADGTAVHAVEIVLRQPDGMLTAVHHATSQAHYYGLGEKTGFLDKRGERYAMWNTDVYAPHVPDVEALYVSVPFVLHAEPGSDGLAVHGLLLDNPGRTVFDFRAYEAAYLTQAETGDLDLYIVPGPEPRTVIERYTALTGRLRLPPLWSLGYHQSRYSYMSEQEVREVAHAFQDRQIPCDAIHLDIHHMEGYRVFTFDPGRFPDPAGLAADLRRDGFHLVPIVDPGVKRDPAYGTYVRGVQGDRFCKRIEGDIYFGEVWPGESAFPDFSDEAVRQWWGEEHRFYVDRGIDGIWNDMNEPAVFNEHKTMDGDVIHRNDGDPRPHRELHNLYGLCMMRATYEGMRRLLGRRPFVLTRAGYAGSGRYGAVWTGDNRSYWEHMEMAIPMVLNLGLSGIPFAGPDIGGFSHHASGELVARWTQMGALFPFCRNHSAIDTHRQEPWQFGPEVEAACREALRLRYRWLPYLYTLFEEAARTGMPVIRPLMLAYPDDPETWRLSDQFLLGPDVLVAPVLRPGQRRRMVYLPAGRWRDLLTGAVHRGPAHIIAEAPLERMPIFIREGAILPEFPPLRHASLQGVPHLELVLYGSPDASGSRLAWYEDDGESFDHEAGAFNRCEAEATMGPGLPEALRVKLRRLHAGYCTPWRELRVRWRFAPDGLWTVGGRPAEHEGADLMARVPVNALDQGVVLEFQAEV